MPFDPADPQNPLQQFGVVPLSKTYEKQFYRLIQEQAAAHHAAPAQPAATDRDAEKLFRSIHEDIRAEAFLIVRRGSGQAVAAVTFYDCYTPAGYGLYLEDIVTTRSLRGQGIGSLAMTALAQIATARGAGAVVWECAADNPGAQKFYDGFNALRCNDQHAWRLPHPPAGAPRIAAVPSSSTVAGLTLRPAEARDDLSQWISHPVSPHNPNLIALVAEEPDGKLAGMALAYRSFSTFRIVSGLHLEALHARKDDPAIAEALLLELGRIQKRRGWDGHLDVTVMQAKEAMLTPVLKAHGFAPLAYGPARMMTRRLAGQDLRALAQRHGNLIPHTQKPCAPIHPPGPPVPARGTGSSTVPPAP